MKRLFIISIFSFICLLGVVSSTMNVILSDQGTGVRYVGNESFLNNGNLQVYIYDASSGGNLVYSELFSNSILNGSWNVMLGETVGSPLPLNLNQRYWKDYSINGENVNFYNLSGDAIDRLAFDSPLGSVNASNLTDYLSSAAGWTNDSTTTYTNKSARIGNLSFFENLTDVIMNFSDGKNLSFVDVSDPIMILTQTDFIFFPKTKCQAGYVLTTNTTTGQVYCRSVVSVSVYNTSGSGTWAKPSGAKFIRVDMWGAGGGGGGGTSKANAAVGSGGSGGGAGSYASAIFMADFLPSNVSYVVGVGGAYGAGAVSGGTGSNGGDGGNTSFGTYLYAYGGGGGVGGANAIVAGGGGASAWAAATGTTAGSPSATPGQIAIAGEGSQIQAAAGVAGALAENGGASGSSSAITAITQGAGGSSIHGAGGGGAGGGTTNVPAASVAADGGTQGTTVGGGGLHGNSGNPPTNGADGTQLSSGAGSGGGGGGAATAANLIGGHGGNGGNGGGGGGGGGKGTTTQTGGNGGYGGNGTIVIYTWYG